MEKQDKTYELPNGPLPDSSYVASNSVFIHTDLFRELSKKFGNTKEYMYAKLKNLVIVKIEHHANEKLRNIVAIGKLKKDQLKLQDKQTISFEYLDAIKSTLIISVKFNILQNSKTNGVIPEVNEEDIEKAIKLIYSTSVLNVKDRLYVEAINKDKLGKTIFVLEITKMLSTEDKEVSVGGYITEESAFEFEFSNKDVKIVNSNKTKNIMKKSFNYQDMGVGGMHDEINKIFRTAFVSRMHSTETLKKFGIKHVKGVLLFGPPGTGKTLIARTLAKMLDSAECTVVNGPELFDKYVGETEKKIRELFVKAEQDEKLNGDNAGLHVIVFDEIDSICRSRGTISSGTGVHDSAVNQLLTKIDGVDSLNNILIIGMTNRKELIDEAILRPGRLEVHVEIGLPKLNERIEIFKIHTRPMRENDILDKDLSLEELSRIAENFTGAEIETLVKRAASYAMNCFNMEELNNANNSKKKNNKTNEAQYSKVTMDHFKLAFEEVKPMFGTDKAFLESPIKFGILNYGPRFTSTYNKLNSYINQLRNSNSANLMSIILHGDSGNGKTALACDVALNSGFPYVKIISPNQLAKLSESGKAQEIMSIFENAYKSNLSIIVLDNIERIIEYIKIGPRFSNLILQTLLVLINKAPLEKSRKLFVIGTTNIIERLDDFELCGVFNHKLRIPNLNYSEVKAVAENYPEKIDSDVIDKISNLYKESEKYTPIKEFLMTIDESFQIKGKGFTFEDYKEIYDLKQYENDI